MKKPILMLAFFFAFSTAFVSCRDQKNATQTEEEMNDDAAMDEISGEPGEVSEMEEANREQGDIKEVAEDVGDVVEEGVEETGEAVEEGWDEVKENTGTGTVDDE